VRYRSMRNGWKVLRAAEKKGTEGFGWRVLAVPVGSRFLPIPVEDADAIAVVGDDLLEGSVCRGQKEGIE